jgi:hypothetical protein
VLVCLCVCVFMCVCDLQLRPRQSACPRPRLGATAQPLFIARTLATASTPISMPATTPECDCPAPLHRPDTCICNLHLVACGIVLFHLSDAIFFVLSCILLCLYFISIFDLLFCAQICAVLFFYEFDLEI